MAALFLFVACAGRQQVSGPIIGQCDPAADEAVHRGDWEQALADHERLVAQRPDDCLALYHLGYVWSQLGDHDQEIQYYLKAEQCGYTGDDQLYFNLGMALADQGDPEGAEKAFEKAVAINPKNPENYFGLGLMYQALGRSQKAETAWLAAVHQDPKHWDAHLALARLYLDQSHWKEAAKHLEIVLKGDPDNQEAQDLVETLKGRQALEY